MKILHICSGLPISNQSGIPNYVRGLAIAQINAGDKVTVLANEETAEFPFELKGFSSKIISFSRGSLVDKKSLKQLKEFFEKKNFDIIHVHMVMNIDWDLYNVLKDYKYIVSLHDYWFLCPRIQMYNKNASCPYYDEKKCKKCFSYIERFKVCRGISKSIARLTNSEERYIHIPQNITTTRYKKYKLLLENAAYVLPVSNRVMQIYKDSGINANYKVLHIGNLTADSFNHNFIFNDNDNERKINLAFMGRLTKTKGADVLLEIAENIDKGKFNIHFYGDSATYKDQLKAAGIINHGGYKQIELNSILKNIDMGLVLPIWEDNGPQVVMEFLNNHVPVIGTKMGGITDFVDFHNGYVFNPYDETEYARLYEFLGNLDLIKIKELKGNILPTTTTIEHQIELEKIYLETVK